LKTKIRKIKKRILSCMLALAMAVSLLPMSTVPIHAATNSPCSDAHVGWTEISSWTEITSAGKYYLGNDIIVNASEEGTRYSSNILIKCEGEVTLCLNGYNLTNDLNNNTVIYLEKGTFNLCDCLDKGYINSNDVGIFMLSDTVFNMYGGTITDCVVWNNPSAVQVGNNATFNMYGGTIIDNKTSSGSYGAVGSNGSGIINIYGGTIRDNRNYGVYTKSGSINISGDAQITGNTLGDVYLPSGKTITLGTLTSGANIGVTSGSDGNDIAITGTNNADYSNYFHADNSNYQILNKDNVLYLHKHSYSVANCVEPATCSCGLISGGIDSTNHNAATEWTTADGKHYHACLNGCGTHLDEDNCSGGTATCDSAPICSICGKEYGSKLGHSYQYSENENVITETCKNDCGHSETATLSLDTSVSLNYTDSEIKPLKVEYSSDNWQGGTLDITYQNNTAVSTDTSKASGSITKDGVTATKEFAIEKGDMTADVTATNYNGTYDGNPHSITVNAPALAKVGYSLDGINYYEENPAYTNPTESEVKIYYKVTQENYNDVTGFATVNIDKIEPTADMFTFTAPTDLVYDGNAKAATVEKTDGEAVGTITLKYYDSNGNLLASAPKDAGTYTVRISVDKTEYYSATQEPIYPTDGSWKFTIEPKKVNFTWGERTFKYTGEKQVPTATVLETDLVEGDTCIVDTFFVGEGAHFSDAGIIPGEWEVQVGRLSNNNYELICNNDSPAYVSFTINKGDQNKPVLSYTSETVDGRNDGEISDLTTAMEYRKASDSNYTPINSERLTNLSDGIYYVRYAAKQYYNASPDTEVIIYAGNKLSISIPETQNGYSLTVDETEVSWKEPVTLTFTLKDGYSKTEGFAVKVNNEPVTLDADGKYTISDIQENQTITVEGVADITAPTAAIKVTTKEWKEFISNISFGIFFKETQEVIITANDVNTGSGIDKVYYYLSETEIAEDDIADITDWVEYAEVFNINPDKEYVLYAKAVDKAGNIVYINSEGLVLDATAPEITGITNGGTYYGNTEFGVTESYLDKVTLDGTSITLTDGKYTIVADDKEHTIIATDKATNSNVTMTVKVVAIASLDDAIESITTSNVKSSDKEAIEEVLELVKSLQDSGKDFTDAEDTKLAEIKSNTESLLNQIKKAEDAADNETTDKIAGITSGNVTTSDKENLEDAKADLEQALQDYPDNYTESEKEAIKADLQRIEEAIKSIEKVEDATDKITNLPSTIEPDDLETVDKIKDAKEVYDALTDHEKSLISAEDKAKLESLLSQAVAYKIVEGNGSSIREDSDGNLHFKANGAYSKFTSIKVDNHVIDAQYYTAESGSTIITLKSGFLDKLSVGTHSLAVMYTDGEATGSFTITEKPALPGEKNESNEGTVSEMNGGTSTATNIGMSAVESVTLAQGASSDNSGQNVPETGDGTNIAFYLTTLLIAGMGLILLIILPEIMYSMRALNNVKCRNGE